MTAQLDVLVEGYADDRVASTVVLVRDGDAVIVVDPGMVADRRLILDPLAGLGIDPRQVTDVVFSHHHPDHTLNAALFVEARFHDHWAIYQDDVWTDREADGFELGPSVRLMATPGHSAEDITTLVDTHERPGRLHPPVVVGRGSGDRPAGRGPGHPGAVTGRRAGAPPGPGGAGPRRAVRPGTGRRPGLTGGRDRPPPRPAGPLVLGVVVVGRRPHDRPGGRPPMSSRAAGRRSPRR